MIKEKIKAFFFHLTLSIVLVSFVLGLILLFWYPSEYLAATNFKGLVLLILSIDIVLGPLLTFVVFNPIKKSLRFDLAVIAVIQLAALFYGVTALYQTHPLYIAYYNDSFNIVHANEVDPKLAKYEALKVSKFDSAKFVYAKMPDDPEKHAEIAIAVDFKGEPDIDKRPEFYEPYNKYAKEVLSTPLDPAPIISSAEEIKEINNFFETHGSDYDSFAFFPLKGAMKDIIIVLDNVTAQPIGTIDLDPWQYAKK